MAEPTTLANDLARALATPAGALETMSALSRYMPTHVKREVIRDAKTMRDTLISAHRMVLSRDFLILCVEYAQHASVPTIASLMRHGMPPFRSLWVEWNDIDEEDGDRETGYRLGAMLELIGNDDVSLTTGQHVRPSPENGGVDFEDSLRLVHFFEVQGRRSSAHDGLPIQMVPLSMHTRFTGPAFDVKRAPGLLMSNGEKRPASAHELRDAARELFTAKWCAAVSEDQRPALNELLDRVVTLPFSTAGAFLYELTNDTKPSIKSDAIKLLRSSFLLLSGLPLAVGIALGMMSLAPIRHVVESSGWKRRADQPATNWRWKLDHNVVTLKRPIRVAEVIRHVQEHRASREPVALHSVMGHWRVTGGRVTCNHIWHPRLDKHGEQRGSSQSLCSSCAAVRAWVTDHKRGTPERGVVSKEYRVET